MTLTSKSEATLDDIAVARRVLEIEARGLNALSETLDARLVGALDLLGGVTGRVIVTGMGKSGHVAHKIAATLASTGTPAQYVHPAEASHGDLGMITREDAVLALSNSGETPELSDLVAYTKLYRIPLVAITGRKGSSLDRAADAALVIPGSTEACPMNLAPTTSTTVMLALGDAIAVALLERRGFSPDDFRIFHPGGQLGRRFIKAADIMHTADSLPLVGHDTKMSDALIEMSAKSLGSVGVTDGDGHLIGIITDGDLRRHMNDGLLGRGVTEIMTPNPKTVPPNLLAAQALGIMDEHSITGLFVVVDDRPEGFLHIHDCLRAGVT